jgi:hypothetical protein
MYGTTQTRENKLLALNRSDHTHFLITTDYTNKHTSTHENHHKYSSATVSTGNTFQALPRSRESADNNERYIERDIGITYTNMVQFNW